MKKISFTGSATLGVISVFMFLCLEVIEQALTNFLDAYLTSNATSYSSGMIEFDFSNLKIILFIMAVVFFALAITSLFFGEKK